MRIGKVMSQARRGSPNKDPAVTPALLVSTTDAIGAIASVASLVRTVGCTTVVATAVAAGRLVAAGLAVGLGTDSVAVMTAVATVLVAVLLTGTVRIELVLADVALTTAVLLIFTSSVGTKLASRLD